MVRRYLIGASIVLIFLVTVVRIASTYRIFSQTIDEPIHVAAGYEWLRAGTYTFDPEHPPLARLGFGAAPFLEKPPIAPGLDGNALLYRNGRYRENLAAARFPNLPFIIIALAVVLVWTARLFDWSTALIALFLFATLPPILGHGAVATTDVAATAMTASALLAFALWLERATWRRTLTLGLTIGLGALSKFSFLPFFGIAAAVFAVTHVSVARPREPSSVRRERFAQTLAICVTAALLVWAGYRFSVGTVNDAHMRVFAERSPVHRQALEYARVRGYEWVRPDILDRYRAYSQAVAKSGHIGIDFVDWAKAAGFSSPLARRSGRDTMAGAPPVAERPIGDRFKEPLRAAWHRISRDVPLPAPFFFVGFDLLARHTNVGHAAFLLGEYNFEGWWYYFPVVWLFKTPIPFVLLSLSGMVLLALQSWRNRNAEALAVAIAPIAMFLPAIASGINIGVRHILPVYPLMAIAAAFAATKKLPRIAVAALLLWQLIATTVAHPDYLAWFNELAGDQPERIALDSNLDWGQDLLRLENEVRRRGIDDVYVSYFGTADLSKHVPRWKPLPDDGKVCGWIAVSEMNLYFSKGLTGKPNSFRWLRQLTPVKRIGKSMSLYNVPCSQSRGPTFSSDPKRATVRSHTTCGPG